MMTAGSESSDSSNLPIPHSTPVTCQSPDGSQFLPLGVPRRSSEPAPVAGVVSVVTADELEKSLPKPSHKPDGAYELKYLIDEDRAARITEWARTHLNPDPHAVGDHGDGYHVNSLYLDTPNLDVFHRSELYQQRKYRLRRYGTDTKVWLEVKAKRKGLVRKQRVAVEDHSVEHRLTQSIDNDWDGVWYRQRLDQHQLRPVCQVTYRRFARVGMTVNGTMRLTIDNSLSGGLANGWQVPNSPLQGVTLLQGQCILELKFQVAMPAIFHQLVADEQLLTTSFSKYRTSVEECVPLDWIAGEW